METPYWSEVRRPGLPRPLRQLSALLGGLLAGLLDRLAQAAQPPH